jgi:DNA-binding IclR family transcriptional regulator
MAKKSYHPVQSDYKFIDIIEFLHQQVAPVSGSQIARALDMSHGTVMTHLTPALERKWVRQVGEVYEAGPRISGMYAAYLQGLKDKKAGIEREINKLEV